MGVNSKYILSCFTDLARLHICGIVVGAGAAGAAAHLQRREMRASNLQHRNLTILNPAAHSWSNACSRELKVLWIIFNIPYRRSCLDLPVLEEVPGRVPVPVQAPVWVSALVESVLEDLPAEGALTTHQDPAQLPEARGGHVATPDGKCSSVADSDVALTDNTHSTGLWSYNDVKPATFNSHLEH